MLRTLVIPFIALAIILGSSFYVMKEEVHVTGFSPLRDTCVTSFLYDGKKASDVLFIGSSRTGAAIDSKYIENRLKEQGYDLTAEQYIATGRDISYLNLLSRKYIENKGVPKHVFIEIVYNNRTPEQMTGTDMRISIRSILLGDLKHYQHLLNEEEFYDPLYIFKKESFNTVDYIATKLASSFYLALTNPETLITDYKKQCDNYREWSHLFGEKEYVFIYNHLDDLVSGKTDHVCRYLNITPYDPDNKPSFCQKSNEIHFLENMIYVEPRDPLSPKRDYENLATKALVDLFLKNGAETVSLYILPSFYDDVPNGKVKQQYQTEFGDTPVIHLTDLYKKDGARMLPYLYRDPNHFNIEGAKIITEHFIDEIKERVEK